MSNLQALYYYYSVQKSMRDLICYEYYCAWAAYLQCGSNNCFSGVLRQFALTNLKFTPRSSSRWNFV